MKTFKVKTWTFVVALGAALTLSGGAFAAPSTIARACAKDIKSVCGDVKPGAGKLKACVESHFADLSSDCQIAIIKVAAVGKACKADMKQYCGDVKPGKGAKAECLKSHAADVSDGCKEALAKSETGNK
jgi:Cysteine rich repeat